jgi:hypothetical protein
MMNVTEFFDNQDRLFRAVSNTDENSTAISLSQNFTNDELKSRSYAVVAADFLTILDYAKEKGLTPKGDSGRSLAFFLTTRGVGNLWFTGVIA